MRAINNHVIGSDSSYSLTRKVPELGKKVSILEWDLSVPSLVIPYHYILQLFI